MVGHRLWRNLVNRKIPECRAEMFPQFALHCAWGAALLPAEHAVFPLFGYFLERSYGGCGGNGIGRGIYAEAFQKLKHLPFGFGLRH